MKIFQRFLKTFQALDRVDLEIPKGSTIALVGASGSGKSTLLRILGGFDDPSSGRIWIDGRKAANIPPQHEMLGFVFQDYALFSHLTVAENIGFSLEIKNWTLEARNRRITELLALLNSQHTPGQLSESNYLVGNNNVSRLPGQLRQNLHYYFLMNLLGR